MRNKLLLLLIAVVCPVARAQIVQSQVWYKVASYGQVVTVTPGITVRYGSAAMNLWDASKLYSSPTSYTVGGGQFPINPATGVKANTLELDVLETIAAQTITVAGAKVTVPGLTPMIQLNYSFQLNPVTNAVSNATCTAVISAVSK